MNINLEQEEYPGPPLLQPFLQPPPGPAGEQEVEQNPCKQVDPPGPMVGVGGQPDQHGQVPQHVRGGQANVEDDQDQDGGKVVRGWGEVVRGEGELFRGGAGDGITGGADVSIVRVWDYFN